MFKRSPNCFNQFQKQFMFLFADEKPNLTASNNYAVCPHFESEFCQLPTNHFHVLIESAILVETMKPIKTFAVPCLFTTFRHLFSTSTSLELKEIQIQNYSLPLTFIKIRRENGYSKCTQATSTLSKSGNQTTKIYSGHQRNLKNIERSSSIVPHKTIHNFVSSTISSKTQTDQFSRETLKRVESILSGPHSGAFCQNMDIFLSVLEN